MAGYFADSYALVEYVKGNKDYKKYFAEHRIITTRLNLMELYYSALVNANEEAAEQYYGSFLPKVVDVSDETIKEATKFKHLHRTKKISYIDAIGYQVALEKGIKFLTGDMQFKDMKNVEFVK